MNGGTPVSTGALTPLFPQLHSRFWRGNPVLPSFQRDTGLRRSSLLLLRAVAGGPPEGSATAQLRPGAPYATRDNHLSDLDDARDRGYLRQEGAGRWRLSDIGMAVVVQLEQGMADYLATLRPLPDKELAALVSTLTIIARCMDEALGGSGGRLASGRRLARLALNDAPMVLLERAARELSLARNDAHQSAWRAAWFNGPSIDILTRLWYGDAESRMALESLLTSRHEPTVVCELVDELIEQGYVEARGNDLTPTRAGYLIRETIEAETDRLYFMHWPELTDSEVTRLHAGLRALIAALPSQ